MHWVGGVIYLCRRACQRHRYRTERVYIISLKLLEGVLLARILHNTLYYRLVRDGRVIWYVVVHTRVCFRRGNLPYRLRCIRAQSDKKCIDSHTYTPHHAYFQVGANFRARVAPLDAERRENGKMVAPKIGFTPA